LVFVSIHTKRENFANINHRFLEACEQNDLQTVNDLLNVSKNLYPIDLTFK